jgi:hypothetical protein
MTNTIKLTEKQKEVVKWLRANGIIYTSRGSAPYRPLFFELWDNDTMVRSIAHPTMKGLISKGIINDQNHRFLKYTLTELGKSIEL